MHSWNQINISSPAISTFLNKIITPQKLTTMAAQTQRVVVVTGAARGLGVRLLSFLLYFSIIAEIDCVLYSWNG